ncbi:hypothetical protein BGX27_006002 [Mortierella sp. AM989]|nr:hypothetical protein BGX27_006002 [Mortierella sp. AM989]
MPSIWSTQRNSILIYGGAIPGSQSSLEKLYEYTVGDSTWRVVNTTGPSPGPLRKHCAVSAYNGTKMIMFGGTSNGTNSLVGIHILDTMSNTWTRGKDSNWIRIDMACAVSGDNFLAWGGSSSDYNYEVLNTLVVYNLKSNKWTTQYVATFPKSDTTNTTTAATASAIASPTVPASPSDNDGSNIGALIGGVVGSITLVLIGIAIFFWNRTRRGNEQSKDNDTTLAGAPMNAYNPVQEKVKSSPHTITDNGMQQLDLNSENIKRHPQYLSLMLRRQNEASDNSQSIIPSESLPYSRPPQDSQHVGELPLDDWPTLEEQIKHFETRHRQQYEQEQANLEKLRQDQQERLMILRQKLESRRVPANWDDGMKDEYKVTGQKLQRSKAKL